MDANRDDLFDFIETLGKEEEKVSAAAADTKQAADDDVWLRIMDALNNWSGRILDAESRYRRSMSFRDQIEESLKRQEKDGFLNPHDLAELRYIADLWTKLLNTISYHAIGCEIVKRNVMMLLLELYSLKQIDSDLFIDICLTL